MSTTIRELKLWLEQFPEDTEVEVLEVEFNYSGIDVTLKPLNTKPNRNWEFIDYSKNRYVKKDHPYFGKKILRLGEE
jgi:hypothetical protein